VWGMDVYTASSAICVAAVHAGVITLEAGGEVTVTLQPKQETLFGSDRNKISSRHWTNWDFMSYEQPYRLSAGAPDSSGSGRRTIRLTGFTAAGSAPVIVPRTISLNGFVATGTAPLIVPRSIPLDGWTGVGTEK
jgi:LCCL domain